MDVSIVAVGKMQKGSPEALMIEGFTKRLTHKVTITEIDAKKARTDEERFRLENEKIRASIPSGAFVVALDSRGQLVSSEQLSGLITRERDQGRGSFTFVLGGADGLDAATRKCASILMSFGPNIWPHMLARIMLIEQVFRAQCIATNHPYHRASGQSPAR